MYFGTEFTVRKHTENEFNKMKEELDNMNKKCDEMKKELDNRGDKVKTLTQQLKIANINLSRLKVRHIMRRIPSLIYQHFIRTANLTRCEYTIDQLKNKKIMKRTKKKEELKAFLTSLDFDDQDIENIQKLLLGYKLHEPAHPVTEVEATVTNILQFEELFYQSDIDEEDKTNCLKLAKVYFKLLDMYQNQSCLKVEDCSE